MPPGISLTGADSTCRSKGSTNANGGIDLSGSSTKSISQRTLNNAATATWTGTGFIGGGAGSTINNLAGAFFLVPNDANFLNQFGGDPYLTTPDEAQAALLQDIKDWEGYVRAARVEPQG